MQGKSIIHSIGRVITIFVTLSVCGSITYAQQQEPPQHPQDFATLYQKARAACDALWADHALDPLRDKFPLGGQKPTFAMLTDRDRLLPRDRPLADLAIKTIEQCRTLYAGAVAMLPQQTQQGFERNYREEDSLIAKLYVGRMTIGDFNVGLSRLVSEESKALYGDDVHPESSDVATKRAVADTPAKKQSLVQKQMDTAIVPSVASHQTRLALVIGNSNYTDLPKLKNPANDARSIVDALRSMGFNVTLITDASETNIRRAVRNFADQSEQADLALVYYAGHGAQVNGENYLLPIDMEIPHTEADIELSSLKVDDLINSVRSTTKIVFLDACRDNPALFKNLVKGRGAIATGLAPTESSHLSALKPGGGVFIAYATDAGSVALEGEGQHSPFTQALLRNLKKPISIDDMFSLVTREVSLVTKGTQRPYKYASLENIVCLTGTCSDTTPAPVANVVQEAERSASDELQVALQTNNPVALQSFLDKYPGSADRQKVLAEIARLRRSEFNEWTLYQISNNRFPQYLKISSIHRFGDRVAFETRNLADPNFPIGVNKYPEGTYAESTIVIDCKQSILGIADTKPLSGAGQILGPSYKWADPERLNLSFGLAIKPGQVAVTAQNIVCNDKFQTPLVSKKQLASMSFPDLSSTPNGDAEIYYQPIQSEDVPQGQRDAIVLTKQINDGEIAKIAAPNLTLELGKFKTAVFWDRFSCQEMKFSGLKSEFYDATSELKYLIAVDLSKELVWSVMQENAPLAALQRILCGPHEVQQ